MAEPKFQTSFIPKKAMMEPKASGGGMGFFLFVSIIIFFVSVGIAAFVYLDKQLIITQIGNNKDIIDKNQASFETATIQSIIDLSNRINVGNQLLDNHVVVSPIFNFLNQATLPNVRFKDFSFAGAVDSSGQKVVNIQMNGSAKDFETVASQADQFGNPNWRTTIKGTKVSNLSLNSDGSVSFMISASVVPDFLKYTNHLTAQQ